jgi:hypothetical protein
MLETIENTSACEPRRVHLDRLHDVLRVNSRPFTGALLWNFTPWRRLKVCFWPSSDTSQDSARSARSRPGTGRPSGPPCLGSACSRCARAWCRSCRTASARGPCAAGPGSVRGTCLLRSCRRRRRACQAAGAPAGAGWLVIVAAAPDEGGTGEPGEPKPASPHDCPSAEATARPVGHLHGSSGPIERRPVCGKRYSARIVITNVMSTRTVAQSGGRPLRPVEARLSPCVKPDERESVHPRVRVMTADHAPSSRPQRRIGGKLRRAWTREAIVRCWRGARRAAHHLAGTRTTRGAAIGGTTGVGSDAVRTKLPEDCLAGVWAHHGHRHVAHRAPHRGAPYSLMTLGSATPCRRSTGGVCVARTRWLRSSRKTEKPIAK